MLSLFLPLLLCGEANSLQEYNVSTKNLEKFAASSPLHTMLEYKKRNKTKIMATESLVEIVRTEKQNLEKKTKK